MKQNTFLVLDTPPEGTALVKDHTTSAFNELIPDRVTVLRRDAVHDIVMVLRRIHAISSRGPEASVRNINTGNVHDFPSLAKCGDRIIVLLERDFETFRVVS